MKVRGDLAPASAFTIEAIPNQFGKVLVRFFENPHHYTSGDISGFEYDEYHLELMDTGDLKTDINNNLDVFLAQAKAQEEYAKTFTPEAVRAREEQVAALNAQVTAQAPVMLAAKVFVRTATDIPDEAALQMQSLFPTWEEVLAAGKQLKANTCVYAQNKLYRVVQDVTPQQHQAPWVEGMLAIYRPIDEAHAGTREDPIPWTYGMDCHPGQYFSYNGHTYRVAEGGTMAPCVWAPDSGIWQWEEIE